MVKTKKKRQPKRRTEKRISSGVPGFDKLVQGGFAEFSTNLVVGGSGVGKSIFATQFMLAGLKAGEKCLYVTFEEKRNRFYDNMKEFDIDLEGYEKKGQFFFLEYTPNKVKTMLDEGGGSIETIILEKGITRMVIDSITSFALLFESETEKREAALSLFNLLNGWDCTTLLTFEEEALESERKTSKALEFESDTIIVIYYVFNKKGERERYLEVLKMRGSAHDTTIHKADITNKGFSVDSKPCKKIPEGIASYGK